MSECGIIGEVDNQVALFLLLDEAFMNDHHSNRSHRANSRQRPNDIGAT